MWSDKRARELKERAEKVIPNGMYGHESTRLLPEEFPQFFHRAEGARLWDADGNGYIDYVCAYGPNLFGHGYAPIEEAARRQQALGDTMTGPSEIMVDLAEAFVAQVQHADWAMFCKNGTDATTMAMTLSRAHRGRKIILYATGTYHGAAPWCTPRPAGIIPEDRAAIVYYDYNDPQSLEDAFRQYDGQIAGVFATPIRHEVFVDNYEPSLEYAQTARRLCDENDALLIVDDVRAGFRLARGCSWEPLGVLPDLACFGKCIANGFPISAVLGSDKARNAAKEIFVTGSFWFSATPMAAAIETLKQIRTTDYLERTRASGDRLRAGLEAQAAAHGFSLRQTGPSVMPQMLFDDDPDFRVGYAWTVECLKRGSYIHPYHNQFISYAHDDAVIDETLAATDLAFEALKGRMGSLEPHPVLMQLLSAKAS